MARPQKRRVAKLEKRRVASMAILEKRRVAIMARIRARPSVMRLAVFQSSKRLPEQAGQAVSAQVKRPGSNCCSGLLGEKVNA